MRVLLVEDDVDIRTDLAALLEDDGYSVSVAVHGRDALRLLRAGLHADVILLDLAMPTMDGWEFRRAQLSDAALAHIPVLVLSAGDPHARLDELRPAGRIDKPIALDQLLAELRRMDAC
jgi:two-component system response regulator MprA